MRDKDWRLVVFCGFGSIQVKPEPHGVVDLKKIPTSIITKYGLDETYGVDRPKVLVTPFSNMTIKR